MHTLDEIRLEQAGAAVGAGVLLIERGDEGRVEEVGKENSLVGVCVSTGIGLFVNYPGSYLLSSSALIGKCISTFPLSDPNRTALAATHKQGLAILTWNDILVEPGLHLFP